MKELSVEEKAKANDSNYKAYTELISRLEDVKEAIKKKNYGIAMDVLCKPYPEFQVTTHSELKESEDERIRKELLEHCRKQAEIYNTLRNAKEYSEVQSWIAWLEKQGKLMKCLQIANSKIGELIEKNYYLKEQLEKQSKNSMGISEATKQKLEDNLNKALEKETQESCNKFLDEQGEQKLYINDNAKEMFIKALERVEEQNNKGYKLTDCDKNSWWEDFKAYTSCTIEQKPTIEMKSAEESLGIDSDTYNKIVDECVYGEQKPIKEHNACEFCEDRYGCVSPCSMKLIEEEKPADLPKGEDYGIDGLYAAIDILQKTLGEVDGYQSDDGILTHKCAINAVKELSKHKPAWSEEDKDILFRTIDNLKFLRDTVSTDPNYAINIIDMEREINLLESIKDRVQPKQEWKQENTGDLTDFENAMMYVGESFFGQYAGLDPNDINAIKGQANLLLELAPSKEWSKEDNRMCKAIIDNIQAICEEGYFVGNIDSDELIKWLKSLRPQSQWKPSDEQMDALEDAIADAVSSIQKNMLNSLYQDLKKLKQ